MQLRLVNRVSRRTEYQIEKCCHHFLYTRVYTNMYHKDGNNIISQNIYEYHQYDPGPVIQTRIHF